MLIFFINITGDYIYSLQIYDHEKKLLRILKFNFRITNLSAGGPFNNHRRAVQQSAGSYGNLPGMS